MRTEIKFYSGIHTIGGVVMAIEYGKDRVLLEVGVAYDPATDVYDGMVKHRKTNWLKDELLLNRVPAVDGVYRRQDLLDYPLTSCEESEKNTAAFITHMHLDHMTCMGMLGDEVKVYLSESAQRVEQALEDTGVGVVNIRTTPFLPIYDKQWVKVGDIEVLPFLLNSKSYQDWSFYVKTPDMKIHYTGDLFLHGDYVDAVLAEMEWVKEQHPDLLVCEATTFMDGTMLMMYDSPEAEVVGAIELPKGMLNKEMVDQIYLDEIKKQEGLCVFNYYEREMSDVMNFKEWAKETNRILAFEPKTAYLVWKFFGEKVNVFVPDVACFENCKEQWFVDLMANNPEIKKQDIIANPRNYLIQNSYAYILELFDLPNENASYIHCGGTPIGDYDPAYANMQRVLELAGFNHVNLFQKNYFSHAYPPQVKGYVDQIDAKVLVPSHSMNPERLKAPEGRQQLIPELGVTYVMEGDRMVRKED